MKVRKWAAITMAAAFAFSLVACKNGDRQKGAGEAGQSGNSAKSSFSEGSAAKHEGKEYKICLVPKDSTNAWFVRMEEGVKKFAADTGINAYQKGPSKTDAAEQIRVIQDQISQGIDALCVVPVDPHALEPVLKQAKDKGIVVICHEGASVENCDYDIEAFNNASYGAFIMDNLAKSMGEEGLYTTMVAHVTNASHNEWADGAVARQKEAYAKMTLLAEQPRVESEDNTEVAYQKAKELFKQYPDLKGIIGTSSKDAPGIARAIDELGLKDKVFTAGTGMPNECRDLVKGGTLAGITLWDPAGSGYALCDLATKVLDKAEIKDGVNLDIKGYDNMQFSKDQPRVLIGSGWMWLDPSNIDDYNF